MKILLFLGLLAFANAQYSELRHIALDAVDKLREVLPDYQNAQDVTINKLYESKRKALGELNSFYNRTLELKANSLKSLMNAELDILSYGDSIEVWCWENNIPSLQGDMGWAGNKYSECIKQLDDSIEKDIAEIYGQFTESEAKIQKYKLLQVFFKPSNIISKPEPMADTISKLKIDITNDIPHFEDIIVRFVEDLHAKQFEYTCCLNDLLKEFNNRMETLKSRSEICLQSQK